MTTNSSFLSTRIANYKLSSSYPVITPLYSKELNYSGSFSFNSYTKSWSSYQNIALKTTDNSRGQEMTNNSDLQPLNWLQKESIIDIDPLDMEDDIKDESATPGYDDLINPQITHAKVEVESQENSNIHDFVRFQAMRNSMNNSNRVALRNNNSFPDCNQNYSHHASGFAKPNLSYTQLIFMAIETCKDRAMTVNDIYQWCEVNYPYYKHIGPSWKNSLRHNLSINKSFRRMPRDGQTSLASYEVANSSDDMGDDSVSHRDHNNKQGGPGRGAYWVVDDKERKNLLDSIYRAHQTMPLSDRNGQRVDQPPYSFIVNPPKNGPMLRIDGRFTDASTYLQSKRSDDEIANENQISHSDSVSSDMGPIHPITDNCDAEYASMMYNLTVGGGSSSPDGCDNSVKLSASYNSTFSSRPAALAPALSEELPSTQQQETDECTAKSKNRRKSKHDKVRNYTDNDGPAGATAASATGSSATTNGGSHQHGHGNGMTSVNVVVAPHFDHIYARYQQFLPPAIASDMEKTVFSSQHASGMAAGADNDNDCNPEGDFLRHGLRDDNDDDDDDDDDNDSGGGAVRPPPSVVVKLEAMEAEPPRLAMRMNGIGDRWHTQQHQSQRLKLNAVSVAFTRQRKVQRAISRRVRHSRRLPVRATRSMQLKREMTEPRPMANGVSAATGDENGVGSTASMMAAARGHPQDAWNSDGYATDSTMPMIARQRSTQSIRRGRRHRKSHQSAAAAVTAATATTRILPIKRKASSNSTANKANGAGGPPEKRYRSKRKRTRPLRIDESQEVAAIQFLASLEKRHQKLKNIENLYNFNAYLQSSLSTGDSSCNSSVVLVHE